LALGEQLNKHIVATLFAVVIGFVAIASSIGAVAEMVGGFALAMVALLMANS